MADEVGTTLRRLRVARNQTQAQLYEGILSPRQAIRVEAGTSSLKAGDLLAIVPKLGLSLDEFAAQLTPVAPEAPRSAGLAVVQKLGQWIDWRLSAAELKALKQYALNTSGLAMADILALERASLRLEPATGEAVRRKLWRHLLAYQGVAGFRQAANTLWTSRGYALAFAGRTADARLAFTTAREYAAGDFASLQLEFNLALLTGSQKQRYATTQPFVLGVWALGEHFLADTLIDNRRHVLTAMHCHSTWRPEELGALARIVHSIPGATSSELREDRFPGLITALEGQPVQTFAQVPPQVYTPD